MFSRAKRLMDELGAINSILYLLDRFLLAVTNSNMRIFKYYAYVQPVAEKANLPAHRGKDIIVRLVKQDDGKERAEFPRPKEVINYRYNQGGYCLAAYKNGVFSGFIWLNFDPYFEDEVRCCYMLHPIGKVAWDYDVYIDPKYRISMVFAKMWDQANQLMRDKNVTHTMSRISAFNSGSLASHTRLGATRIGQLLFFKLGPWQLMFSSAAPYVHFSTNEKVIPSVNLKYNAG